ncbi:uncharacterized protein [Typha angustifolia]|uniref:uncharacterized protein n=1 Tax=Typha angustifolia TaxID=59011 RepID=UPI003C2FEBBE
MAPCRVIDRWSFRSLVGAYLDLAIAYLFLSAAALAFLASKFLSLFGLALPCPSCDGLFGHPDPHANPNPNPNPTCLQSLLVDYPTAKISGVHHSVRTRLPFDGFICLEGNNEDGSTSSSGSVSTAPKTLESASSSRTAQGKGVLCRRRRRSAHQIDSGAPTIQLSWEGDRTPPSEPSDSDNDTGCDRLEKYEGEMEVDLEVKVRNMERALEEERTARVGLCRELEKERSAAAGAADEAMAMILRLQEEKGAIEMETRHYQRLIEEKSAYDQEEMAILKEIIVRREREKHVLEKEVDAYRQMLHKTGKDGQQPRNIEREMEMTMEQQLTSFFDSSDDPGVILKQISDSIEKKGKMVSQMPFVDDSRQLPAERRDCKSCYDSASHPLCLVDDPDYAHAKDDHSVERHHLEVPGTGDEQYMEFQEKGMVTMEVDPIPSQSQEPSPSMGHRVYDRNSHLIDGANVRPEKEDRMRLCLDGFFHKNGQNVDNLSLETDALVHDVHVIDDKINLSDDDNVEHMGQHPISCGSGMSANDLVGHETFRANIVDCPSNITRTSLIPPGINNRRSCSDMANWRKLVGVSCDRASHDLRRSSMSAVDGEKLRLQNEVELLRERLKIIQQGREKLSFSVDQREKATFQLQLLEEIACQLKEIKKATAGKSARQSSLPPLSSKARSKRRRCRSASLGLNEST